MARSSLDRRPGIAPPPPPVKKGPRFSYLAQPKGRFFDFRTTAFLLGAVWLFFYLLDRLYFGGLGYRTVKTCLETGLAYLHIR
jgi:hypothetical protein